jgi:protoheme IX farnesyltransferase
MNTASDIIDLPDAAAAVNPASRAALAPPLSATLSAARARATDFYELTKPRMNFLVVVTTMVGFYMATRGAFADWALLVHTVVGTALAAAGASVLNQYVERGHDALMRRTANRPLPAGRIAPLEALVLGVGLSAGGAFYLSAFVNGLTATLGVITIATYVFLYTPMKRWTTLCTVVGAVPGAIPPMMGWSAASNNLPAEAWALFGILFFWQMPHFLAIAILYRDDYAAGGFKMLPVVDEDGVATGRQMVLYGLALIPVSLMPVGLGMAGPVYFVFAIVFGLAFLGFGVACALRKTRPDARRMFFASIVYLPLLLAAMMLDKAGAAW